MRLGPGIRRFPDTDSRELLDSATRAFLARLKNCTSGSCFSALLLRPTSSPSLAAASLGDRIVSLSPSRHGVARQSAAGRGTRELGAVGSSASEAVARVRSPGRTEPLRWSSTWHRYSICLRTHMARRRGTGHTCAQLRSIPRECRGRRVDGARAQVGWRRSGCPVGFHRSTAQDETGTVRGPVPRTKEFRTFACGRPIRPIVEA